MNTMRLNTEQLEVGMIVHHYGARFQLARKRDNPSCALTSFVTEYMGNVNESKPHTIPRGWESEWTVEGNYLRMWTVEA